MKMNSLALANATALVALVVYFLCWAISLLLPDLVFPIVQSWVHSLDLTAVRTTVTTSFRVLLIGSVTITILTWTATFAAAALYNRLAK